MIPYRLEKRWPAISARFSIYENTAMEQDGDFQARCDFIYLVGTIIIGIPPRRNHFEPVQAKLVRMPQILTRVFKRWVDYCESHQPILMPGNKFCQIHIGQPQRATIMQGIIATKKGRQEYRLIDACLIQ